MNFLARKASNFKGTNPLLGQFFIGTSAFTFLLAAYNHIQAKSAETEVEYRKTQLSKPLVKLSDQQLINPPWNKDNIDEWLYRRVQISGRPIHRLACLIPRNVHGGEGFEYVVPLVVKQNQDRTQQYGVLFSKGFIPYRWQHIGNRYKIEDPTRQTFVGFVSKLEQLDTSNPLKGNATQQGRLRYSYANLDDLAESTGFLNKKKASVALIQRLYENGDLNERRGKRYSSDADFHEDYPYYKTEAGALQLPQMPWNLRNKSKAYFVASLASFAIGASIF